MRVNMQDPLDGRPRDEYGDPTGPPPGICWEQIQFDKVKAVATILPGPGDVVDTFTLSGKVIKKCNCREEGAEVPPNIPLKIKVRREKKNQQELKISYRKSKIVCTPCIMTMDPIKSCYPKKQEIEITPSNYGGPHRTSSGQFGERKSIEKVLENLIKDMENDFDKCQCKDDWWNPFD
tara:strand:- start:161 stop:694 length:534 start_codon:yes stop_codon:yes gene_type:complete